MAKGIKRGRSAYTLEREKDVLRLLMEGKTTKEMADAWYVTEGTMYNILKEIFRLHKVKGSRRGKRKQLTKVIDKKH